jgi:hypothetical protein
MNYKIAWSGLADKIYWEYIAKFCVPSWTKLPGDKFVIHDGKSIKIKGITTVSWEEANDPGARYLQLSNNKKSGNFWRKMRSQLWAIENLKDYDIVVLLDTDVEILDFDTQKFEKILKDLVDSNMIWATGESQLRKLDAGHIVINMKHPDVSKLFSEYEDMWNSGKIFNLRHSYDGDVVESMLEKYPSLKIQNRDYGSGLHVYEIGTVHWGSKLPKQLRAEWPGDGKSLVEKRLSEITIKKYKNDTATTT